MREQTVAMYCLLDDLIRFTRPAGTLPPASGRRLTDAQVLTTALVATRFFGGNLVVAKPFMAQHWGQHRLNKSDFTRRLHALTDTLLALFATLGDLLKQLHPEARHNPTVGPASRAALGQAARRLAAAPLVQGTKLLSY